MLGRRCRHRPVRPQRPVGGNQNNLARPDDVEHPQADEYPQFAGDQAIKTTGRRPSIRRRGAYACSQQASGAAWRLSRTVA
jgi:hypothetical protein